MEQQEPQLSDDTLIEALAAEADYQDARAAMEKARGRRYRALYASWREVHNASAVARALPRSVTTATVRTAVVLIAPPTDFTQLSLLDMAAGQ